MFVVTLMIHDSASIAVGCAVALRDIGVLVSACKESASTSSVGAGYIAGLHCGYLYLLMDGGEVVYIGASTVANRPSGHRGRHHKDFDQVLYLPVSGPPFLHLKLEEALIRVFKTKYNKCWYSKRG